MGDIEKLIAMKTLLNSGDVLQSRYRILHQLGHGGFSRTYLAEDINRFNERCVLKEFAPQLRDSFTLRKGKELFEREAGVLYRLQHPQIPKFRELFRYKQENNAGLLLVQDYIEGQNYHELGNQRSQQQTRFSEAEIARLLMQILPVLEYIHSRGVIHRDISPENLVLRSADRLPTLIDFGCIKQVEQKTQSQLIDLTTDSPNSQVLFSAGTVIGKIGYAPPEQIDYGTVWAHSDLYALAATAVVLLTGKQPRQLINPNGYYWNWQEEVTLSPKLEWILTTMLSPNPSDRFSTSSEVRKILQDVPAIALNTPQIITANHVNRSLLPTRNTMMEFTRDLTSKRRFYSSLSAVLILGGLLCLKVQQDLTLVDPAVFSSNLSAKVDAELKGRFSQGEKILIPQTTTPEKKMAVAAFAQSNYNHAVSLFSTSLKTLVNDPEALIYLNNARIGKEKSYSIAVSVPIGSDVNAAQEILRGVAQAQEQINQAGGIDRIPLKVQIINDDNDPEIAKQVAQALSQDREILGVVGHYASDVTLATAEIYQEGELVTISPISTSVKLSNLSPYLFRTVPSDYVAGRSLAKYMLENLQQKNVAVFYNSQSNYSESLKSEFMAAVALGGGRVVHTFDLSDPNFSAANSFQQAVAGGAEVIMLAANTGTLDKALQVVEVNHQRLSLLAGDDVYAPKTLQVVGESAQDMVLAIPWHSKNNPNTEFVHNADRLWGGEVNWRTAMAYDAAQALINAIALNPNPTRIAIQKTLADPHFSTAGANGQVHFLPSGDRLKSIELVKVRSGKGNFNYKFTPIADGS